MLCVLSLALSAMALCRAEITCFGTPLLASNAQFTGSPCIRSTAVGGTTPVRLWYMVAAMA